MATARDSQLRLVLDPRAKRRWKGSSVCHLCAPSAQHLSASEQRAVDADPLPRESKPKSLPSDPFRSECWGKWHEVVAKMDAGGLRVLPASRHNRRKNTWSGQRCRRSQTVLARPAATHVVSAEWVRDEPRRLCVTDGASRNLADILQAYSGWCPSYFLAGRVGEASSTRGAPRGCRRRLGRISA